MAYFVRVRVCTEREVRQGQLLQAESLEEALAAGQGDWEPVAESAGMLTVDEESIHGPLESLEEVEAVLSRFVERAGWRRRQQTE